MAHVAVDRRAPVAAVAFAGAVVQIQHDVAALHQQVVEHLLAEVGRVAMVDVLQVTGAMHEHHDRIALAGFHHLRAVVLAPHLAGAVLRRHLHDFRLDPLARLECRRARVRQCHRRAAGRVDHRQLGGHVGAGMGHQQAAIIRRQGEALHAVQRGDLGDRVAGQVQPADLVIGRIGAVAQEEERTAVGGRHR